MRRSEKRNERQKLEGANRAYRRIAWTQRGERSSVSECEQDGLRDVNDDALQGTIKTAADDLCLVACWVRGGSKQGREAAGCPNKTLVERTSKTLRHTETKRHRERASKKHTHCE